MFVSYTWLVNNELRLHLLDLYNNNQRYFYIISSLLRSVIRKRQRVLLYHTFPEGEKQLSYIEYVYKSKVIQRSIKFFIIIKKIHVQ